jgi:hypothetical protein
MMNKIGLSFKRHYSMCPAQAHQLVLQISAPRRTAIKYVGTNIPKIRNYLKMEALFFSEALVCTEISGVRNL